MVVCLLQNVPIQDLGTGRVGLTQLQSYLTSKICRYVKAADKLITGTLPPLLSKR